MYKPLSELTGGNVHTQFTEKVIRSPLPVVVEFFKNNSGTSFLVDSILAEFVEPLQEKAIFYKVNIDKHQLFNELYHLNDLPSVLLFRKGSIRGYLAGPFSRTKFISSIINNLDE
ncbi:MAG TPA: thioredoxin domain-containing protein [Chryseolinea sp.]